MYREDRFGLRWADEEKGVFTPEEKKKSDRRLRAEADLMRVEEEARRHLEEIERLKHKVRYNNKPRKPSSTKGLKKTTKPQAALNKEKVQAMKVSCLDCDGEFPHYVLQFDHVRGKKVANISAMLMANVHWDLIAEEIEKCEIVCANCHAVRTHTRRAGKYPV